MHHLGKLRHTLVYLWLVPVLWLSGCSTLHHTVIIAPIQVNTGIVTHQKTPIRLSTNDKRTESYVIQISENDGNRYHFNSNTSPYSLLSNALRQGLGQQGYVLSQQSAPILDLNLENVMVNVEQGSLSYKALSLASATLTVSRNNQQLVKRYQSKGQTTGVMSIDTASLEREINDRLSQLLHAILNDNEVHQFIR